MSAHDTVCGQTSSSAVLAWSMMSNPLRVRLGVASFSGFWLLAVGSSSTEPSHPCIHDPGMPSTIEYRFSRISRLNVWTIKALYRWKRSGLVHSRLGEYRKKLWKHPRWLVLPRILLGSGIEKLATDMPLLLAQHPTYIYLKRARQQPPGNNINWWSIAKLSGLASGRTTSILKLLGKKLKNLIPIWIVQISTIWRLTDWGVDGQKNCFVKKRKQVLHRSLVANGEKLAIVFWFLAARAFANHELLMIFDLSSGPCRHWKSKIPAEIQDSPEQS